MIELGVFERFINRMLLIENSVDNDGKGSEHYIIKLINPWIIDGCT